MRTKYYLLTAVAASALALGACGNKDNAGDSAASQTGTSTAEAPMDSSTGTMPADPNAMPPAGTTTDPNAMPPGGTTTDPNSMGTPGTAGGATTPPPSGTTPPPGQ